MAAGCGVATGAGAEAGIGGSTSSAAAALRRPPVTDLPARSWISSTLPSSAALICEATKFGCADATSAAAPVTYGVAIEVPCITP